ncbi:MAG: hypothetical protein Q7J42_06445 [Sulfuritalea sp.]|nr:hypothetical protein [Sulfuritalea sp.]
MVNRNVITVGICALLLVACGGDEAVAKKSVLGSLKDPDSAKFGKFVLAGNESASGKQGACLEVNAKNAMGGYTGAQQAQLFRAKKGEEWQLFGIDAMDQAMCIELMTQKK